MSLSSLEKAALRFLREETYSSVSIIQLLLEHNNVQATHQLLKRMKAKGYLSSAKIQAGIYTVPLLYGITEFGQAYAWDLDEDVGNTKAFQPSKVSAFILQHELDMQLMHIKALKLGWSWNNAKNPGKRLANVKYQMRLLLQQMVLVGRSKSSVKSNLPLVYVALLQVIYQCASRVIGTRFYTYVLRKI